MMLTPGLAAAQMPLPSLEPAPPLTGLYIGAGAGFNWMQNQHLIDATGTAGNASLQSHFGWAGAAASAGPCPMVYALSLRATIATISSPMGLTLASQPALVAGKSSTGPMVNVLYDMTNLFAQTTGLTIPYFAPYIGVGVGYQWAHLSGFTASGSTGFPSVASNDTYGAIAYQFILGGAVPIPSVRGLAMTVEYRFFGMGSRKYNVGTQAAFDAPVTFGTAKLGNDFNHSLMFGLRYNFGQPPPPPPAPAPVPAAAPARSYLVFFDWDKATLTAARSRSSGSGGQLDQGAVHADRGERLHRYLGHTAVQPGPVDPPCAGGGGRTGEGRRAEERDRHPGLRRNAPAGADRSRRARAAEPPGRDHHPLRCCRSLKGLGAEDCPRQREVSGGKSRRKTSKG